MLKPLNPGYLPLGQFDLEDDNYAGIKGGEVAVFESLDLDEGYAGDSFLTGPRVQLRLGTLSAKGLLYGLVDEGDKGYGTPVGEMVGGATGKGTGMGAMSTTGAVVIGPKTVYGSGKATLWVQPGLYGVSVEAWVNESQFDALALNAAIYGTAATGKLTTTSTNTQACVSVGLMSDTSLVSTTTTNAGATAGKSEMAAVFLLGVQAAA